ncbi:MAG: TRAP transporter small permease subunit [Kiloniellales bacterium]
MSQSHSRTAVGPLYRVVRAIESLTEGVGFLAALVVIPLVLATCYEVFARYVFGAPTIWAFELGYTLMGVHFLLGGALTLKRQGHVRIDLIYGQLSRRKKAIIDLTLYLLLVLPALVLVSLRLSDFAAEAYASGETTGQSAWNPPIWPFRAVIAFSFVLLTLQVVAECLKSWRAIREPVSQSEGAVPR